MAENSGTTRTSSPVATGGAGPFFEQHVAAYWLSQLLVRGIPPVLINTVVREVYFQSENLGWKTDDFLIVCEAADGGVQKLAGQVKLTLTISSADDECRQAMEDFWQDYQSPERFSPASDRLVLVTLRGTNTLLKDFFGLLECARTAHNGEEFERRLSKEGFISKKSVRYCGELQKIIAGCEGRPISMVDLWPFLRVLHVLSLDLNTSTRQTEALIKSLLAHTVSEGEPIGVAGATWNALLALASTTVPEARRFLRDDLSAELRNRHAQLATKEQRVLRALKEHTTPILRAVRSTIGPDFHLPRSALVQSVLSEFETAQVVLISGPAGSGKSAIGKAAVTFLSQDYFAFGFRAEEFAQAHFDATLSAGQIPANLTTLTAILAAQSRKVVLVESVERLLERSTRDAFSDLLTHAETDPSMRIVLTCRDYSSDQVLASFLRPAGITHSIVEVPPLDDAELAEVEAHLPRLGYPLANPALRMILRNPYFLDKALSISWSGERPLPESEREFRTLFWREIVRADHRVPSGTGRRREEVFQEVAIRRARALSAHVICKDLDPAIIGALLSDSLLDSPPEHPLLVATAHDVLEDWAILQWLEEQHLTAEGAFTLLASAIGPHPAIRRSYRKWVAELVDRDPDAADRLFRAAIAEEEISAQFRDDTLVSLLRVPSSPDFLARHEAQLVGNDRALLKRVIHLLRVACVTTPAWLADTRGHGSVFNVPDGPAWAAVLRLVHRNLAAFTPQEHTLLLSLIEDAARGVSWWAPRLDEEEAVAAIGHWLLAGLDDYSSDEARKRVLKVIAKVPLADPARFGAALRGTRLEGRHRDGVAEDFQELLFSGIEGMAAARDLPDLIVEVAKEYLLATDESVRQHRMWGHSFDLGTHFGINDGLRHDFFPASALRGPWLHLLRYHPRKGLSFFIDVFNHSADWYVHPRVHDPLEPAWENELTFADGTTRNQWGNPRLWNLYRGTSVGPYVLQSLLMTFEKWLLEYAEKHSEDLDAVLVEILRRSDSAALAAVVASVATAHPHKSGDALLVLLTAPDYIRLDRGRMAGEHQASALSEMFSGLQVDTQIHEQERNDANGLPHRRHDLEAAIATLQLGPLASRVQAVLDQHLAALPPKSEQDDDNRLWRLAVHRMDIRQYTISDVREVAGSDNDTGEPSKQLIQLQLGAPDPDVQAMVAEHAAEFGAMNARLGTLLWGTHAYKHEAGQYDPLQWRETLQTARSMDRDTEQPDGSHDAPGLVAAVCVRDQWAEMSDDERDWCLSVVCDEILRAADDRDPYDMNRSSIWGVDRACASVVPSLLHTPLRPAQMVRVRDAFAVALTHPVENVRWSVAWGIDAQFWATDRVVAMRCVNAIATEATLVNEAWQIEKQRPYEKQIRIGEITAATASAVRNAFWKDGGIPEDAHERVDISHGFGARAAVRMLAILGQAPEESVTVSAYVRASRALVAWWDSRNDSEHRRDRDFHTEADIARRLYEYLMRASAPSATAALQPVLDAIDDHPREIFRIIDGLRGLEDVRPNTPHYWFLWGLFAEGIKNAKWASRLDNERSYGSEILSAIFLTTWWKDDVRHWRSLEGYAHHVHHLFEALRPSAIVLEDYVRFLYHIGEQSLPEAFIRVSMALKQGDAPAMLRKANTVFLSEILLQRFVYGRPLELKREPELREAVLFLLDTLVETGSSAAFRMRDDFVTPVSAT